MTTRLSRSEVAILKRLAPRFVAFEGIDGSGKSTLIEELSGWLKEASIAFLRTREPGGTRLGEQLRELLLDPSFTPMNHQAEVMLYSASRAQLVQEIIRPAMNRGMWVLADRYTDATLAYQGYGRGMDRKALERIQEWATGGLQPHLTVLLDCEVMIASRRMSGRKEKEDRIEQEDRDFHQRVRDGYLKLARATPERFLVLDGSRALDKVRANFQRQFIAALRRSYDGEQQTSNASLAVGANGRTTES